MGSESDDFIEKTDGEAGIILFMGHLTWWILTEIHIHGVDLKKHYKGFEN